MHHEDALPAIGHLALFCFCFLPAQPADDTKLKQLVIFGRRSVRVPVVPNATFNKFSVKPFRVSGVDTGILADNGAKLERILGGYYRLWLTNEGPLTGSDSADANFVYFRANVLERTIETARLRGRRSPGGQYPRPVHEKRVVEIREHRTRPVFDRYNITTDKFRALSSAVRAADS